jgi:hypothetical protein
MLLFATGGIAVVSRTFLCSTTSEPQEKKNVNTMHYSLNAFPAGKRSLYPFKSIIGSLFSLSSSSSLSSLSPHHNHLLLLNQYYRYWPRFWARGCCYGNIGPRTRALLFGPECKGQYTPEHTRGTQKRANDIVILIFNAQGHIQRVMDAWDCLEFAGVTPQNHKTSYNGQNSQNSHFDHEIHACTYPLNHNACSTNPTN